MKHRQIDIYDGFDRYTLIYQSEVNEKVFMSLKSRIIRANLKKMKSRHNFMRENTHFRKIGENAVVTQRYSGNNLVQIIVQRGATTEKVPDNLIGLVQMAIQTAEAENLMTVLNDIEQKNNDDGTNGSET